MLFKKESLLDNVSIASPCPVKFDQMPGDEKVRFCSLCHLNVYNISQMTRNEAEELLETNGENVCLRLYRRSDGTLITKDCPEGKKIADRIRGRMRSIAAAIIAFLSCGTAFAQQSNSDPSKETKRIEAPPNAKLFDDAPMIMDGRPCISPQKNKIQLENPPKAKDSIGPDTSAKDSFDAAINFESAKNFTEALNSYDSALSSMRSSKVGYDKKFAEMVAKKYVQLLRKQKQFTKAKSIEREFSKKK